MIIEYMMLMLLLMIMMMMMILTLNRHPSAGVRKAA